MFITYLAQLNTIPTLPSSISTIFNGRSEIWADSSCYVCGKMYSGHIRISIPHHITGFHWLKSVGSNSDITHTISDITHTFSRMLNVV